MNGRKRANLLLDLAAMRAMTASGEARAVRVAARLSQAEVAAAALVSAAAISRWEAGRRVPQGVAAVRYARVLRVLADRETQ